MIFWNWSDRTIFAYTRISSTRAIFLLATKPMKLFSALGLVVVFVLLAVMMNPVFHALERTLLQFFSLAQDTLELARHALATVSLP